MDNITKKQCFVRGVYDYLERLLAPSIDYAGDLEKIYMWGCGYYSAKCEIEKHIKDCVDEMEAIPAEQFSGVDTIKSVNVEDMLRKMGLGGY